MRFARARLTFSCGAHIICALWSLSLVKGVLRVTWLISKADMVRLDNLSGTMSLTAHVVL